MSAPPNEKGRPEWSAPVLLGGVGRATFYSNPQGPATGFPGADGRGASAVTERGGTMDDGNVIPFRGRPVSAAPAEEQPPFVALMESSDKPGAFDVFVIYGSARSGEYVYAGARYDIVEASALARAKARQFGATQICDFTDAPDEDGPGRAA